MRSWAQPTAEEIERVRALAGRPENRAYFFDRLENPLWVRPLAAADFFAGPPEPMPAAEPGYVRFPPWPEGRYLTRVAAAAPEAVAEVLRSINGSSNPTVIRHLLEALVALPDKQFQETSEQLASWLEGGFVDHFDDEAAAAIVRLLEMGVIAPALDAARCVLAVQPDPRLAEKASAELPFRLSPEASGRLSDWHYERMLERVVGALSDAAGVDGLEFVSSLLEDALRLSTWDDENLDAGSQIWRPAIEDHPQNSDSGVRNALVSATRDVAVRVASKGEDALSRVVDALEARTVLHRRVALHVLAVVEGGEGLVDERIGSREVFDDYHLKHEYATLLRNRFSGASEQTRSRFLSWVSDGPNVDEYRQRRERFDGGPPNDEAVEQYARRWRRDWLSFVADYLESADAERYRDLVTEVGHPEHPDFTSWSSSWTGPESPLSGQELGARTIEDIHAYLRSWRPEDDSGWHFGPSVEGLGRILSEDVKTRASGYASSAAAFVDLDPTYVRSIFSGLANALRDGEAFEWEGPLALAEFVVSRPFEPDEEVPDRDRDPGWRWCRGEVASLMRTGFSDRPNRIPFGERERAWSIIERLLRDPNPSSEHEARYGGDNMDPLTLSINTNRGNAMHAVIEYALWVRRELEARKEDVSRGFELIPEAREALDAHLDPEVEPSLAVHAVYGRWLPWLLLLDEAWVRDRHSALLPAAPLENYRDVVWTTYISWCPPYDSAFRALRQDYEAAVGALPSGVAAGTFRRESVDAKLGEHLVTFFWRGVTDLALLDEFFARADDELAGDVMEFIGRSLRNTTGEVPDDIRVRIQELWERRLSVAGGDPEAHMAELQAFGTTFAAAKLDQEWALANLERAVGLSGAPTLGHWVVERLIDLAQSRPAVVTSILAAMLEHPQNEWDHLDWRDEARRVVEVAVSTGDVSALERARSIVDYYVRHGELDFRDLLRST
jgi:hypothetical protein